MRSVYAGFVRRIIVLLSVVALAFGLGFERWYSGGLSTLRVVVEETKYEGTVPRLRNDGILPALVERCTYTTDTNKPGETIAYNIDKWDPAKRTWVRAFEFAVPEMCSPMPTSHGGTKWQRLVLWPGQSITGWSVPIHAFRTGDQVRVVAVTGVTTRGSAFASDAIQVK